SGAQPHANLALNYLKPYLNPSTPADTKATWAERVNSPYQNADNDPRQRNCSYLYEFSTRICQSYVIDDVTDPASGYYPNYLDPNSMYGTWASDFLVEWFDDGTGIAYPSSDATGDYTGDAFFYTGVPYPDHMSKFGWTDPSNSSGGALGTGLLTWQEV